MYHTTKTPEEQNKPLLPECCIQNLSFLQVRRRNLESVVLELGNIHPSELLLRLGELSKIGGITETYTTT